VSQLTLKSDPRAFFPDGSESRAALTILENEFYAFTPIRVLVRPAGTQFDSVELLRTTGAVLRNLQSRSEVIHASMQPANRPDSYLLTALIDRADNVAAVRTYVDELAGSSGPGVAFLQSDLERVYEEIDSRALASLNRSLLWSLGLILVTIAVTFRSVRAFSAAALVNCLPLLFLCALMWLTSAPFNLVTALVFVVALGIVVDDTVHILFELRDRGRLSESSTVFSIVLSTTLLCLGLLLCQLSGFETTRAFGAHMTAVLIAAVICDLALLPRVLGRWR